MSNENPEFDEAPLTAEEKHTALFAQMVMQSASMALMFMGRTPNPVSGKTEVDLDGARMFIEQLEMLEIRTKGNLTPDEQRLLKQNLMTVRLAFVQTVEAGKKPQAAESGTPAAPAGTAPQAEEPGEASKKKFSKSYGEG